jgi:hypothetical protein
VLFFAALGDWAVVSADAALLGAACALAVAAKPTADRGAGRSRRGRSRLAAVRPRRRSDGCTATCTGYAYQAVYSLIPYQPLLTGRLDGWLRLGTCLALLLAAVAVPRRRLARPG